MFKVKNLDKQARKFRIHKTAQGFLIRPGEELIVPYPLIIDRPDIFEVIDLDKIEEEVLEGTPKMKRTKKEKNIK